MMKTDWSLPPEDPQAESSSMFSFCNSCHFVRLKTLLQGFVSLQITFQSTDADLHIVRAII